MTPEHKAKMAAGRVAARAEREEREKRRAARLAARGETPSSTSPSPSGSSSAPSLGEEAPPNLPPPRKTTPRTTKTTETTPSSWLGIGENLREVPLDEKEREEALKPYAFYARMMAGAISKLYDFASDMPLDEEERAAAIEAFELMCFQLNLSMLDYRLSLLVFFGTTGAVRVPATKKKWFDDKLDSRKAATETVEREMGKAVRVVPMPPPEGGVA